MFFIEECARMFVWAATQLESEQIKEIRDHCHELDVMSTVENGCIGQENINVLNTSSNQLYP